MYAGKGTVVVGRDTRPTGRMVEEAVIAGLQSVGNKPLLAGVVPTPTILYLTRALGANGGIAITASHNDVEWNALKFVGRDGMFLRPAEADELFDIYHQQDFPYVEEFELRRVAEIDQPMQGHLERIVEFVSEVAIRAESFRVAVDCCNGVGAIHSVPFLRDRMGCEVFPIHDRPDGRFERPPEPIPQNLEALGQAVRDHKCAVGFAQDPDGDRLALLDETGTPIGEDLTLALAVRQVLSSHARGRVVTNQSASKVIDHVAAEENCEVIRTKTGEIYVSEKMMEIGAVVGGESNGGVIVPAVHPCRDSYTAMALILELMAETGKTIASLRSDLPKYELLKQKVPIRPIQAPGVLRAVRRHYGNQKLDLMDGIFVDFGDRWLHIRRSNTEPILRIMTEAPSRAEVEKIAQEAQSIIEVALD
jgi:phosphomannomutase